MDINKFLKHRPYLYHLTDEKNLASILEANRLQSTLSIAQECIKDDGERTDFLQSRRPNHVSLTSMTGVEYWIRDQKPINMNVLKRSLTKGYSAESFIETLNSRVFWWPTVSRLNRHFGTYEHENPIIIRVRTKDILDCNDAPWISRLNTGSTRCVGYYNGNAATRGHGTFLNLEDVEYSVSLIAEVTFLNGCYLPRQKDLSNRPAGPWSTL